MTQYIIISEDSPVMVERQVIKLLSEGWKLAGGISTVYKHEHNEHGHVHGHVLYSQALTKDN